MFESKRLFVFTQNDPDCQIKFCHGMQNIFNETVL